MIEEIRYPKSMIAKSKQLKKFKGKVAREKKMHLMERVRGKCLEGLLRMSLR